MNVGSIPRNGVGHGAATCSILCLAAKEHAKRQAPFPSPSRARNDLKWLEIDAPQPFFKLQWS